MSVRILARTAYVVACAAALLVVSLRYPSHNWDMIAYVAVVYEQQGLSGQPLADRSFGDVRAATSVWTFDDLTSGPYRESVYRDPAALEQQLPFYRIRPLYTGLVRALVPLVPTVADATVLASALAATAIMVLSGLLMLRASRPVFLAVPLALVLANILSISRASTPDALAAALAVAAFYCAAKGRMAALVILPLLPAARTDFVLLVPLMAWALWPFLPRRAVLISALAGLAVYAAIGVLIPGYGHLTLFNFALIHGPAAYVETMPIASQPADYARAYLSGLRVMVEGKELWQVAAAALLLLAVPGGIPPALRRQAIAAFGFLALHFLLFPSGFHRTYFLATWAAAMVILAVLSDRAPIRRPEARATGLALARGTPTS